MPPRWGYVLLGVPVELSKSMIAAHALGRLVDQPEGSAPVVSERTRSCALDSSLSATLARRAGVKVGDLAVKKIWSDQDLSEFSKVNLIGQI